jgi:hypothetical protein
MEVNVMVQSIRFVSALAVGLLLAMPAASEAGPPLICHPFQTDGAVLLPWGDGSSWNTPDRNYDVRNLAQDTMRLLSPTALVLARMENIRRATIYAARDRNAADQLLAAVLARAQSPQADAQALFDAGYLIESYKQAVHLHRRAAPTQDGYAMVRRAIATSGESSEMEFAASLMTQGAVSDAHRRRAQAGASAGSLLARNLGS